MASIQLPNSSIVTVLAALLFVTLPTLFHEKNNNMVAAVNVTYDYRSLLFDGERKILISGSIHYPRSTPEMWPDLIAKAKDGGLDVIQTYVFWNMHEPEKGTFNFEGRYDLVNFVKIVHEAGLFVNLRIGPFISAEWNFGGLPVWLHLEPGVIFRTDNTPFKAAMQNFTTKIVQMMKEEELFAWQGGPIIMAQIENEFGEYPDGTPQKAYAMWAAEMALGLDTGVPWIMCKQKDAPDPVINTWNDFYADNFEPNAPYKPKMWTENWTGWFQDFGSPTPYRPEKDIAFAVSRFFQKNGAFQNYYMYHGGTNFGRTSGGPFISTSYDYDAPLDEYGLPHQPKWGHLKELHQALKLCEPALITGDASKYISFGPNQEAFIFSNGTGNCAAFLSNIDTVSDAKVHFNGQLYELPAWSVSILPDCKNVAFNSAKVRVQTTLMTMRSTTFRSSVSSVSNSTDKIKIGQEWEWYNEPVGLWGGNTVTANACLEQIRTTRDTTDYLWYITSVQISEDELFLNNGTDPVLFIDSMRDAVHIFINGQFTASAAGDSKSWYFQVEQPIKLHSGQNQIAIMSMTVGLQNAGTGYEMIGAGIQGSVILKGLRNGSLDLSSHSWIHQVGLKGENLSIYSDSGVNTVDWDSAAIPPRNQSLIWYKTEFDAPSGEDPVAIDLVSMGKGQAWINGQNIGRFWPSYYTTPTDVCSSDCDYRGSFYATKCLKNCGQPSQRWYHVPRSWLKPSGNLLVMFEEMGGDPTRITIATRSVYKICAHISENYPPPINAWPFASDKGSIPAMPAVTLQCEKGKHVASITFASFGTPHGTCGKFQEGVCHAPKSLKVTKKACLGKNSCFINVSSSLFGKDPCPYKLKTLAVEAICSGKSWQADGRGHYGLHNNV